VNLKRLKNTFLNNTRYKVAYEYVLRRLGLNLSVVFLLFLRVIRQNVMETEKRHLTDHLYLRDQMYLF